MSKIYLYFLIPLWVIMLGASQSGTPGTHAVDAQENTRGQGELFPMKGLSLNPPEKENVGQFCVFIKEELAPLGVNALFLRIDWKYEFSSYPEMGTEQSLRKEDIKKILRTCNESGIELVPAVNLLGHQSWSSGMNRFLEVFPQFDENPDRSLPNPGTPMVNGLFPPDGFYCKSYCPLHPDLHQVVFRLIGEIIDVFEAKNFHAGMDEVLTLADDKCPRCAGKDRAKLFADEANLVNAFVKSKGSKLWIWGDRLIDANLTTINDKAASANGTASSIDLIDKDISICDWHYGRPELTPVIFAYKGFDVAICPYKNTPAALQQLDNTLAFRNSVSDMVKKRFVGIVETDWGRCEDFMNSLASVKGGGKPDPKSGAETFFHLFSKIKEMEATSSGTVD